MDLAPTSGARRFWSDREGLGRYGRSARSAAPVLRACIASTAHAYIASMAKTDDASRGGEERARRLTAARRIEIARLAAFSRWVGQGREALAVAKYGAEDRPLRIGPVEIPCYVLADGRRVLAQRGLQWGLGLSTGGGYGGARKLTVLMQRLDQKGIDTKGLIARANSPIRFIPPHGGTADGYEASILADICGVIIDAEAKGSLGSRLSHLAERARLLQTGFATVGLFALIDEATGYQEARSRDALAKILEQFVAKEIRPWVKTFPSNFYREIFRLNKWEYSDNCGRPGILGHWTNNIVYKRLAPGVLEELKRRAPADEKGRRKVKLFQHLTDEVGHPKLREHLAGVTMLMKYSPDWQVFMDRLDREYPQWGANLLLPYPDDYNAPE